MASINDFWLPIREKYQHTNNRKAYLPREVVAWALNTGKWKPDRDTLIGAGVAQLKRAVKQDIDSQTGLPRDINYPDPQGRLWIKWTDADWGQRQQFLNMLDENVDRATAKRDAYVVLFNANRKNGEPEHQLRLAFV